jgi:hypothetical protein
MYGMLVHAAGSSRVTFRGGEPETGVWGVSADDSATIEVVGRSFEVDGAPVPYGDLSAQEGMLTGTFSSGGPATVSFRHAGASCYYGSGGTCEGTVRIAPPDPGIPSLPAPWLTALATLLIGGVFWTIRRDLRGFRLR